MKDTIDTSSKDKKHNGKQKEEETFAPLNVILARDLIFMDWTINFGSQILGIIVGALIGFMFGTNLFDLFKQTAEVPASAYLVYYFGIALSVVGLTFYYIQKMGVRLNSPKKISSNWLNIIKISFFGLAFVFGASYLYKDYIVPAAYKISGIDIPLNGGDPSDNGSTGIDIQTTNQYILLLFAVILTTAVTALLYAGLMYSMNRKIDTLIGIAIITPAILLTFTMLFYSIQENLLEGRFLIFLTDFAYFLVISIVTILVYHMSRRIELTLIVLFLGYTFGYGGSTNIIDQIIALKWGFPNFSDNVTTTADTLTRLLQILQYTGLFGMVAFPVIFYKDTIRFGKNVWKTIKIQGLHILAFLVVVLAIDVLMTWLMTSIGNIFITLIIFIGLIWIVNSIITKRYGKKSYTGMLATMTKATLQMSGAIIPPLEAQSKLLEGKAKRRTNVLLVTGTVIPVVIYFVVMYITTAITSQTLASTAAFMYSVVPLSIAAIAFATTFFFVKDPLIKGKFSYPIKALSVIGGIVYFIFACNQLIFNNVGYYPLFVLFYPLLVYIPIRSKKKVGSLLLSIPGENRKKALRELLIRKDMEITKLEDHFYSAPPIIKVWLALILSKRGDKEKAIENLSVMLKSGFPLERATSSLCLLFLKHQQSEEKLVKLLENDVDPRVRKAIAYGFRYPDDLSEEMFKRIIDSQHYEDDAKVQEVLKKTIVLLDERFDKAEKETYLEEI